MPVVMETLRSRRATSPRRTTKEKEQGELRRSGLRDDCQEMKEEMGRGSKRVGVLCWGC